jgi:tRNA A-37 threonylcarbamoyl transferase component Bud32
MNKESALANLGLQGSEDKATVARLYGERLSVVQDQLIKAQTDAERGDCQLKLSQLVESYEFVTGTGRYTQAANDSSATVMRTGTEIAAAPQGDTAIRMEPGAVLSSRLEIGALLGQGGMGNVYAARDRLKDEDVAIKVLRQDLLFSTAAKERFLAEAKVSCNLSHPNIVRVYDVGQSGSYYYFSMERLKGHNLRHRIEAYEREKREFSVEEVTDIARQLIDALRYAHRYIVHRDIKPENIWISADGTVKLMDFGIARAYSSVHMTQTGMTLGTAYYMAPEQRIAAKDVDWRADQYSLGVVLYELLAGTLPTGAVKPLETVRRDLPKRYARALMRAMSPKPEDRFPALADLLAEMDGPERKVAVGIGGLLLIAAGVAAAGGGAYFFMKPAAPPTQVAATTEPAKELAVEKVNMP